METKIRTIDINKLVNTYINLWKLWNKWGKRFNFSAAATVRQLNQFSWLPIQPKVLQIKALKLSACIKHNGKVKVKVYARPLLLLSAILACPGQSSVFRLMPKLAGGYGGGKHQDHLVRPMLQVNHCCTRLPGWIQLKVTASLTLVNCLIFQSILQCSLHYISQPPHIRYCNWTEITLRTPRVQSVTCLLWSRGNWTRNRVDSERCVHQSSCRH